MLKSISGFVVLSLTLILLVAGCGGGDASITKAELIRKGDAICENADNAEFEGSIKYEKAHAEEYSNLPPGVAVRKLRDVVGLPVILKQAEELEALGAPKGDEEEVKAIIVGIEEAVKKGEQKPASLEATTSANPFSHVNRLAQEYGFKACSEAN